MNEKGSSLQHICHIHICDDTFSRKEHLESYEFMMEWSLFTVISVTKLFQINTNLRGLSNARFVTNPLLLKIDRDKICIFGRTVVPNPLNVRSARNLFHADTVWKPIRNVTWLLSHLNAIFWENLLLTRAIEWTDINGCTPG